MRHPKGWFGNEPASALLTRPFPGENGQYPARDFFKAMGFKEVGEDPDLPCHPIRQGFVCRPIRLKESVYVPQEDDRGGVVVMYSPSSCPWSYFFLKMTEREIEGAVQGLHVRWIDSSEEPAEAENAVFPKV